MKNKAVLKKQLFHLLLGSFLSVQVLAQQSTDKSFYSNSHLIEKEAFDRKVELMIETVGIPAVSIAVIENNEVVYTKTYGVKELSKNNPTNSHTLFEGASLTKLFLVYVVNKLVEEGKFDLDQPMYKYLEHEELKYDDRYKLITPRMIMSHSSGIENWKWFNDENVLEILADPGTEFVYSGEGFQYLAKVIEKVTGKPYDQYIQEMVIKPFKLNDTYMEYGKRFLSFGKKATHNYAIGYNEYRSAYPKWKNLETVPASGVHCNAAAIAELIIQTFNGKNLSQTTISRMQFPQVELPFVESGDSISFSCGLGYLQIQSPSDSIVAFSGINEGFRSEVFYSTVSNRGFVFLTNSDRGGMIITELNRMTANLSIETIFADAQFQQYPSEFITIQKMYNETKAIGLTDQILELQNKGTIGETEISAIADWLAAIDEELSVEILNLIKN